jgi:hypothetical protein
LALLLLPAIAGCAINGPRFTPTSHLAYNEAVQQSERQELLLNLVRLRYLDSPEFLAIGSVSTQMSFGASASISGLFGEEGGTTTRRSGPGISAQFSESPTVTFVPLRDEEFMRRLVSPISLDTLHLLTRYGWGINRTLQMIAEEFNGHRNSLSREEPTSGDIDEVQQFIQIGRSFQAFRERHHVDIDVVERWTTSDDVIARERVSTQDLLDAAGSDVRLSYDSAAKGYRLATRSSGLALTLSIAGQQSDELSEFLQLLRLKAGRKRYDIRLGAADSSGDGLEVQIRTRSVLAVMAYLSHGVRAPDGDVRRGIATGNLPESVQDLFPVRVLSQSGQPENAVVAVPYRGSWFYVEEADLETQRTLGALSSLVRLEIGAGSGQFSPVLTLPVGR